MDIAFLQDFNKLGLLSEHNEKFRVVYDVSVKAIELAMLGMADEADRLFQLLHEHGRTPRSLRGGIDFLHDLFYYSFGKAPPGCSDLISDKQHAEQQHQLWDNATNAMDAKAKRSINLQNVTEDAFQKLSRHAEDLLEIERGQAARGYESMKISQTLAVLLYMAKELGREDDVAHVFGQISKRITSGYQASALRRIPFVWKEFLLPGRLRGDLGLSKESLQIFADDIYNTTRSRLEHGPLHPDVVMGGLTMRELLDELEQNTRNDKEYDPTGYGAEASDSILRPPATGDQISGAEQRVGRTLPDDLKEFYSMTNATGLTPACHVPGFHRVWFIPIEELFLEDGEDYMGDYTFYLLPDSDTGLDTCDDSIWPGLTDGGLAMYEHDGQGTNYLWLLRENFVTSAKAKLQKAYDGSDDQVKKRIDKAIEHRYTSRESYDAMRECIYLQHWGEPDGQAVFPSFRSYVNAAVFASRFDLIKSPLIQNKPLY